MRCHSVGVDGRHDQDGIADFRRITPFAADDSEHLCPNFFAILQCANEIGTNILLKATTANREDEEGISRPKPAGL